MWIRFILRLAREIFSYETLGRVMLNVLKDDGAILAFLNFGHRFFDERVRNGIVSFRWKWKTNLVDYDGHLNLRLLLEAQFVLFPSLMPFGIRLAHQSGGEDDAEGGRSWIATLRLCVLLTKLKLQRGTHRTHKRNSAVVRSFELKCCVCV